MRVVRHLRAGRAARFFKLSKSAPHLNKQTKPHHTNPRMATLVPVHQLALPRPSQTRGSRLLCHHPKGPLLTGFALLHRALTTPRYKNHGWKIRRSGRELVPKASHCCNAPRVRVILAPKHHAKHSGDCSPGLRKHLNTRIAI